MNNNDKIEVIHDSIECPRCGFVNSYVCNADIFKRKYALLVSCKKCGWTMNVRKRLENYYGK